MHIHQLFGCMTSLLDADEVWHHLTGDRLAPQTMHRVDGSHLLIDCLPLACMSNMPR